MNVPYSMDDSEPDLYGGMGGYQSEDDQYDIQTRWESEPRTQDLPKPRNVRIEYVECPKFYTQEDMNKVIQHNIKAVRAAYDEGWSEGYREGVEEGNQNCQHR